MLVTNNGGVSWTGLSPDLTRNDKEKQGPGGVPYTNEAAGGEVYNTIAYLEASPHTSEVLWTGSDCGLVHVTTDGGDNWQDVTPPGIGEALINAIDVSPHNPAKAYAAITKYKFNDFTPMIYVTEDYGKTWQKRVSGIGAEDYVRVVREDEKVPGLLYAGTETGIYISHDDGRSWKSMRLNMPACPITDLALQDNDLIVATSGRSFWILDDLSTLQTGTSDVANQATPVLFTPKPSYRISTRGRGDANLGKNPPEGIIIDYFVPADWPDSLALTLDIMDDAGDIIRTYSSKPEKASKPYPGGPPKVKTLSTKKGVNRFSWDMRRAGVEGINGIFLFGGYNGAMVPPGTYQLRLTSGDYTEKVNADLLADPRVEIPTSEYQTQYEYLTSTERMAKDLQASAANMNKMKNRISTLSGMFEENQSAVDLMKSGEAISKAISTWERTIVQPDQKTFQDVINFPNKLSSELLNLMGRMGGMIPTVTDGMKQRLADLTSEYNIAKKEHDRIASMFDKYNEMFLNSGLNILEID